jgi:hypothetical protein
MHNPKKRYAHIVEPGEDNGLLSSSVIFISCRCLSYWPLY